MYLLAVALAEAVVFVQVAVSSLWAFVACAFLAAAYCMWYLGKPASNVVGRADARAKDGREYTGEGRWEWFRSLHYQWLGLGLSWRRWSPVEYAVAKSALAHGGGGGGKAPSRMFVFTGCCTPMPLIWGVGLHGGRLSTGDFEQPLHYILPPPYFWVPLLREFLMWTGAVTYSLSDPRRGEMAVLRTLLAQGRWVCYAPSLFSATADDGDRPPRDDLLMHLRDSGVGAQLVMVTVQDERARYGVLDGFVALRQWCMERLHYPFPVLFWRRRRAHARVLLQWGPPVTLNAYPTLDAAKERLHHIMLSMRASSALEV